ncbi:Protein Shroom1 [Camelus dromedarius]|uniref:Protein Shroom1 n=1 Tax=Camelus dromedarius TaxID=9838 RepID=A0A5N4EDK2_CAMDR|nr:Protein Shroom1 [Camelus dromedarius]
MEALGPGGDRASPASSTRSLDLRRLSARADSAYSSFSAASGGAEPRTPSPGSHQLPYLDWDYVRVVWGGPRTSPRPPPAAAARSGPRPPEVQGTPGPLSRQATPLLYALAAEAEARAGLPSRPVHRPRGRPPPAAAGRARRECSEETSFQRKELRMSLPARLRPAAPVRPPAAQTRSASLSHPGGEVEPARPGASVPGTVGQGRLASQQRKWCFSEPGKLDRVGRGGGLAEQCSGEVCSSSGLARPELQEWQQRTLAEFEGHQIRWLPVTQPRGIKDLKPWSLKFDNAYSVHASNQKYGAGLGQRADQTIIPPQQPLHECPETAGTDDCWQGVNGSVGVSRPTCCSPPNTANGDIPTIDPTELLTTDSPTAAETDPFKPLPVDTLGPSGNDTPGPPDHTALAWATGQPYSRPTWPGPRLEELVQELARLDPSLSDTLTSYPSPEPSLGLLDGLIPLAEVWAAMRPACGEDGEEASGTSKPGSYLLNSTQGLPTSQEETKPGNLNTHAVPDQPCGQGLPEPNNSIQAKKVELADLLQKMLRDLQEEQERLQEAAQAWARRGAALEAAVGRACAPHVLERFSRFMVDLERVLGLLLLLGSRLARVRRALARAGADGDPDEQASLLQRLGLLQRQQEDAKELKQHVARRERALREVLVRALPAEELRAYCSLLAGKAAVLAQQRSLDERVRLLQDQLDAVRGDLGGHPPPPRPAWPPGTCPPNKLPFPPLLI